jgi:cellulose synthase/poly-beta-1,6-N-acetylglucosamine synthase-like glycosyltransferase
MHVWQILFWFAIGWVVYAEVGYLAVLMVLGRFIRRPVAKADITPKVSLLIAAHNEEAVMGAKLENALALDYPRDELEIIVMSDASTDHTDAIVRSFAGRGVHLNRIGEGRGKPNAMNLTVPQTTGEIIVISDADSTYAPDALRKLMRNFADPQVGAVTGEEQRVAAGDGAGLGESFYCKLDNHIKRLEGQMGSMDMVNGGFVAIRRELYPTLDTRLNFDLVWAPALKLQGYRTAYEPEAISIESYPLDSGSDFRRRLRTVLQAFYSYLSVPGALNPLRSGWYAVELFSHRFARWFVLPWLSVALVANVALAKSAPLYRFLLAGQALCYGSALVGWTMERAGKRLQPFYIAYYFLYIHLAAFIAVMQALTGKRLATWTPTQREVPAKVAATHDG